jgi:DNA-binding HxlR family transcriptional regulator
MALFDLLGRRWTLRILWELRDGALTFRELQQRCDTMSSSVLNRRLRELRDVELIALHEGVGYRLTGEGQALLEALAPLHVWAAGWGERIG